MTARRWFAPLCVMMFLNVPVPAQSTASRPAAAAPSTQPVTEGSVSEAMRHLATVPRPRGARESSPGAPANQKRATDLPHSRVLPGPDPGPGEVRDRSPQADRGERASAGPSDEDIRHAFPDSAPRRGAGDADASARRYRTGGPGWGGRPGYGGFGGVPYEGYPGVGDGRYAFGFNGYPFGPDYDVYRDPYVRQSYYWRFQDESNARTDRILKNYSGHLAKALELFNRGQYVAAADAFQLACDTHQGDPAARLYAAHAFFAIGRYRDAIPYLRRAFELQPRVLFLGFDIRDDYGRKSDFDTHRVALEAALQQSPNNIDRLILLGYVLYFGHERDQAYNVLRQAYRLDRNDPLVIALMENSRPPDVMLDANSRR